MFFLIITLERDATDINNLINFYNIASLDLSVLMRFLCGPHITPRKNQMGPMWAMWERHGHHIPTLPHVNTKWGPCGLCGKDMGPTCPCRTQIGPIWGPLCVLAGKCVRSAPEIYVLSYVLEKEYFLLTGSGLPV